jgi:hypothetical protein
MLSNQCHIDISIHNHCSGQRLSSLMSFVTLFYIVSANKFGTFERILKFNLYTHVQNSNDTFTNPLISENHTVILLLILLNRPYEICGPVYQIAVGLVCSNMAMLLSPKTFSIWMARYQTMRSLFSPRQAVYTQLQTELNTAVQH